MSETQQQRSAAEPVAQPATPGLRESPTLIIGAGPAGLTAGILPCAAAVRRLR